MSGDYDSSLPILREMLALSIMARLDEAGFTEIEPDGKTQERVFSRSISPNLNVRVYTTVVGQEVRDSGKDAIRVCATYRTKDGKDKGIVKATRVHRTGNIEDITERMIQRMRDTWKSAKTGKKCYSCGAPTFIAKSGKSVCAEICWLSKEQKEAENTQWKLKNAAKRHRNRYRRRF
tara:strand:+ start:27631 stop:28161 length:531 start_codon:yes stop_codon:yes gene_type:complete